MSSGAGAETTKKRAKNQKFYSIFFKKSREWKGQSPGVRMKSGHLKNRLPAIRRGRHFPQAGNRAFSQVVRLFSVAVYRPLSRKAGTSENCGFVLCTKCGPRRTARKQFSKGLHSKTGVQQHPKNDQKTIQPSRPSLRGRLFPLGVLSPSRPAYGRTVPADRPDE